MKALGSGDEGSDNHRHHRRWSNLNLCSLNFHGRAFRFGYTDLVWTMKKKKKRIGTQSLQDLELESLKLEFHEDFNPKSSIRESICSSKLEFISLEMVVS